MVEKGRFRETPHSSEATAGEPTQTACPPAVKPQENTKKADGRFFENGAALAPPARA